MLATAILLLIMGIAFSYGNLITSNFIASATNVMDNPIRALVVLGTLIVLLIIFIAKKKSLGITLIVIVLCIWGILLVSALAKKPIQTTAFQLVDSTKYHIMPKVGDMMIGAAITLFIVRKAK